MANENPDLQQADVADYLEETSTKEAEPTDPQDTTAPDNPEDPSTTADEPFHFVSHSQAPIRFPVHTTDSPTTQQRHSSRRFQRLVSLRSLFRPQSHIPRHC